MNLTFKNLFLPIVSIILLYLIFKTIDYLAMEKYIIECFQSQENNKTSHTVSLPLTTTHSCQNFCGPNARCAITGQQCFADIDCPGCQPYSPPLPKTNDNIPGSDDAGKLTVGVTPTYSPLTSGFGTKEKIVTDDMYGKPLQANFGVNIWRKSSDEVQALFDKRYKPGQLQYMPQYKPMYSITGEFLGDGPLPANY
jgi:hypothetical protein